MNIVCLLVVLLPSATLGDLRIKVRVDKDPRDAQISCNGKDISPITDAERERFDITDIKLIKMVEKMHGKRPNSVYVRPEGEHGYMFKKFNWPPMMRVLKPISARVTNYEKKPASTIEVPYENDSDTNVTHKLTHEKEFSTEVSNSWSSEQSIGVGVEVSVSIGCVSAALGADYSHTWGSSDTITKISATTISSAAEINLMSKESACLSMNFTVNYLHLEIKYLAHWIGCATCAHESPVNNHYFHHFYYDDFQKVNSNLKQYITVTQRSVIEYCSEVHLTVTSTGEKKKKERQKKKDKKKNKSKKA
nr:venom protein U-MPTX.8-14 [Megalopyge opercularis]